MNNKTDTNGQLTPIDETDFISNEFISQIRKDENISSSMLDCVFIPSRVVPAAILKLIAESAEQVILQEIPLMNKIIEKPYWKDRLFIEVFGTIVLAGDRCLLDGTIANGMPLENADKYTLRQVAEGGIGLKDVDWGAYKNQKRIDENMWNSGTYYHIPVIDLCNYLGIKVQKSSRESIVKRIRRLRNSEMRVTPEVDGKIQTNKANEIHFLGQDYHLLLDRSKMKGKDYNEDTFTDIIINIDDFYLNSLEEDGIISRKRLQNHYIHLIGKNDVVDCYKYFDSHKRKFLHNKYLSDLIIDYFDTKMDTFGINRWHKIRQLYKQIVQEPYKLQRHFGLWLREVEHDNFVNKPKGIDYQIVYKSTDDS